MALGQNLVALVNIKIAGKWVFTPLRLMIIGFDTHPSEFVNWDDEIPNGKMKCMFQSPTRSRLKSDLSGAGSGETPLHLHKFWLVV